LLDLFVVGSQIDATGENQDEAKGMYKDREDKTGPLHLVIAVPYAEQGRQNVRWWRHLGGLRDCG
jgi:hypothetical protein